MNRQVIIITAGRVAQMLIMFLTYRVLSTIFSVSDMGSYYFMLSISAAFGLIYANPIGMYANRMLHSWKLHGVMLKNLNLLIFALFVGSLITIPFLFIFKDKFTIEVSHWFFVVGVLVFYVFSTSFNAAFVPSLNLLGFTNHFVAWTLFTNLIGLILSVFLVKYISSDPLYWLLGQAIALTIFGFVSYIIIKKNVPDLDDVPRDMVKTRASRVAKFALPIVVTNVAVWVLAQSFRFFYKENIDSNLLGELAFGLGLSTALCVAIEYLFQQLYFPEFYEKINSPGQDKGIVWNNLLNNLIPSYIYFTSYIICMAPFIMRVLADTKFKNSGYYLALGGMIEPFRMFGNVFTMATQSEMKTYKAIGPYISGGTITLLGILYISNHPEYVRYTPFCLMAGYLVMTSLLILSVRRMIKIHVSFKAIVKTILSSFVFILATLLYRFSDSLVNSVLINALFGTILLFFLYRSYKTMKEIK